MKSLSAREFNQDVSLAKRAARTGPVIITDRGRPTHVLLSIEAYRGLTTARDTIVDLLAVSEADPPLRLPAHASLWRA